LLWPNDHVPVTLKPGAGATTAAGPAAATAVPAAAPEASASADAAIANLDDLFM
jgi:hypothetical protein